MLPLLPFQFFLHLFSLDMMGDGCCATSDLISIALPFIPSVQTLHPPTENFSYCFCRLWISLIELWLSVTLVPFSAAPNGSSTTILATVYFYDTLNLKLPEPEYFSSYSTCEGTVVVANLSYNKLGSWLSKQRQFLTSECNQFSVNRKNWLI